MRKVKLTEAQCRTRYRTRKISKPDPLLREWLAKIQEPMDLGVHKPKPKIFVDK